MNEVKCECGHINPHGTILCESCGKVLEESEQGKTIVDMRYEGTARRSQTYNKTIVDKIWNFFSSVKVGIWLIVITLIASALGTIFPQELYIPPTIPPEQYYKEQYGVLGGIYYSLGFHNLYSSWWYLLLVAAIGISLVICSLDRYIPLRRALKKQRVDRHIGFLQRQRIYGVTKLKDEEVELEVIKNRLKERRFKVREVNGSILAEKNRFSRWGPYVNHIGLIIFLIGGMLRLVPGMYIDEVLWLREGEVKPIPGTNGEYYLENKAFLVEVYDKDNVDEVFSESVNRMGTIAKNFQTDAILYSRVDEKLTGEEPELEKVKEHFIRVNQPLKFESFALYQVNYKLDELATMSFNFTNKESGEVAGTIKIDLNDPEDSYDLGNGYSVKLVSYFPDFKMDENGKPVTISPVPNNPAFVFRMISPEVPEGEVSFVAIQETIESAGTNIYKLAFAGVETNHATALTVRKDLTLPVLGLGGLIFMIGVVQGAYWNHRRVWIQRHGDEWMIAAHTNKNWHGLKRDLEKTIEGLPLNMPEDQADRKNSSQ